jgi:hypothetical protein
MAEHQDLQKREIIKKQVQEQADVTQEVAPFDLETADMVDLQRVVGNQGIQRMLGQGNMAAKNQSSTFIQTKLAVGPANDAYEQEADRVADQVMAMPDTAQRQEEEELQMKPDFLQRQEEAEEEEEVLQPKREDILQRQEEEEEELQAKPDFLQRQEEAEEEEEMLQPKRDVIQRKGMDGGFDVGGDLEDNIRSAKGGGHSLPDTTRDFFESRFDRDFSSVRVHSDSQSDSVNRSIQAKAFTSGQDIFFKSGEYDPGNSGGQRLLAHELTHVVQQNGNALQRKSPQEKKEEGQA